MRIAGVKTAKNVSRWLRARLLGGAFILGYHRVYDATGDVYENCVSPQHFEEHLHQLRQHTNLLSLSSLIGHLNEGSFPERAVAITFDDGYADNLYAAKPLLEKYNVPATVFICTGYAGREFWWDEVERLVTSSQTDQDALQLHVGDNTFRWDPRGMRTKAKPDETLPGFRHSLYHFLLSLDVEDQKDAMNTIRNWAGISSAAQPTIRAMDHTELLRLVEGGLVEVGAHTRHHPMLPKLSYEKQKQEITSSKHDLEAVLGRPVLGFAYPNGRATAEARQIVQEAGFTYACTSLQDVVRPGADLYSLTRFWQQDVDGDKFISGLNLWMKTR